MELSGPGVQYISDNQLYNSIITAHAILMIFFMVENFFINFISEFSFSIVQFSSHYGNNSVTLTIGNNNDDFNKNTSKDPKQHKYIKILINDPFNNRDIILKVTKKQIGVYL